MRCPNVSVEVNGPSLQACLVCVVADNALTRTTHTLCFSCSVQLSQAQPASTLGATTQQQRSSPLALPKEPLGIMLACRGAAVMAAATTGGASTSSTDRDGLDGTGAPGARDAALAKQLDAMLGSDMRSGSGQSAVERVTTLTAACMPAMAAGMAPGASLPLLALAPSAVQLISIVPAGGTAVNAAASQQPLTALGGGAQAQAIPLTGAVAATAELLAANGARATGEMQGKMPCVCVGRGGGGGC